MQEIIFTDYGKVKYCKDCGDNLSIAYEESLEIFLNYLEEIIILGDNENIFLEYDEENNIIYYVEYNPGNTIREQLHLTESQSIEFNNNMDTYFNNKIRRIIRTSQEKKVYQKIKQTGRFDNIESADIFVQYLEYKKRILLRKGAVSNDAYNIRGAKRYILENGDMDNDIYQRYFNEELGNAQYNHEKEKNDSIYIFNRIADNKIYALNSNNNDIRSSVKTTIKWLSFCLMGIIAGIIASSYISIAIFVFILFFQVKKEKIDFQSILSIPDIKRNEDEIERLTNSKDENKKNEEIKEQEKNVSYYIQLRSINNSNKMRKNKESLSIGEDTQSMIDNIKNTVLNSPFSEDEKKVYLSNLECNLKDYYDKKININELSTGLEELLKQLQLSVLLNKSNPEYLSEELSSKSTNNNQELGLRI